VTDSQFRVPRQPLASDTVIFRWHLPGNSDSICTAPLHHIVCTRQSTNAEPLNHATTEPPNHSTTLNDFILIRNLPRVVLFFHCVLVSIGEFQFFSFLDGISHPQSHSHRLRLHSGVQFGFCFSFFLNIFFHCNFYFSWLSVKVADS